jgi:ribosomal protein S6--L-glutamate ligase
LNKHITIGWQEWVSLPNLMIPAIKVKVDTGAKTSSIHAENIEHFYKDGVEYIRFDVLPLEKKSSIIVHCEAPFVEKRQVKSSNGEKEHRPIVLTTLKVGELEWEIELNLTNRKYMTRYMLLGRNSMVGKVMINPGEKFLLGNLDKGQIKSLYAPKAK